jgi:hypothetical protein
VGAVLQGGSLRELAQIARVFSRATVPYRPSDNQFDLAELKYFLPLMVEYDMVIGFRVYRYDSVLRSMMSWIYNRIVRVLFRVRVRDVDCSYKLLRREILEKISIDCEDFFVDTELVRRFDLPFGVSILGLATEPGRTDAPVPGPESNRAQDSRGRVQHRGALRRPSVPNQSRVSRGRASGRL